MFCARVTAILLVLSSATANAAVFAYDGFSYAPGPLAGQGPGTGFSTAWSADANVQVQAATLSSPLDEPPTGGAVNGFFNYGADLSASLGGLNFWASFLVSHSGIAANQVYMGLTRAGTPLSSLPDVAFGIRSSKYTIFDNVGSGTASALTPVTPPGSTDFLLAHFVLAGASYDVSLFVNPVSLAAPNVSTVVPALSYGEVLNQNQGEFVSDEIRIGDTAADAGFVPEPASIGLVAFGGLAFLACRCRN